MVKVRLEDIDKLRGLVREINVLIYLHDLAVADIDDNISNNKLIKATDPSITQYLLEKQVDVVSQINDLIYKEDFMI